MAANQLMLFSTESYRQLRDDIGELAGCEIGNIEHSRFPDGEHYRRLVTLVDGRDVVLLGGTISNEDTLEIFDVACTIVTNGACRLTLVIPYFGYSTMERAVRDGEVVTAKTRARLLSSIPSGAEANRIVLFDLHSEGLPHYLEGNVRSVHLYSKSIVTKIARRLGGDDFVLACTDAGRAKWVESLANDLGVMAVFVFKRRMDGAHVEVRAVSGDVRGKRVVIYDDMIRSGNSLIQAAAAFRDAGADSIAAIATHGLFPGEALEGLRSTGLFTEVVCTDSHPRALEHQSDDFLSIQSIAGLLTDFLGRGE